MDRRQLGRVRLAAGLAISLATLAPTALAVVVYSAGSSTPLPNTFPAVATTRGACTDGVDCFVERMQTWATGAGCTVYAADDFEKAVYTSQADDGEQWCLDHGNEFCGAPNVACGADSPRRTPLGLCYDFATDDDGTFASGDNAGTCSIDGSICETDVECIARVAGTCDLLTGLDDMVWDGSATLSFDMDPGSRNGPFGRYALGGARREVGLVMAWRNVNAVLPGDSAPTATWDPGPAHKGPQTARPDGAFANDDFPGATTVNMGAGFQPFPLLWVNQAQDPFAADVIASNCGPAGDQTCGATQFDGNNAWVRPSNTTVYGDATTCGGRDQWRVYRAHYVDYGLATMSVQFWVACEDGSNWKILDLSNLDVTGSSHMSQGFHSLVLNTFFNGPGVVGPPANNCGYAMVCPGGVGTTCAQLGDCIGPDATASRGYRLVDNFAAFDCAPPPFGELL